MATGTWQLFLHATESLSEKELDAWFDVLLTPAEKQDIADRMGILKGLLDDAAPQRELSDTLGVSISKITRGSNALKQLSSAQKTWLKRLIKTDVTP